MGVNCCRSLIIVVLTWDQRYDTLSKSEILLRGRTIRETRKMPVPGLGLTITELNYDLRVVPLMHMPCRELHLKNMNGIKHDPTIR